ncbi:putative transmembrane protein 244, partial [Rhineura floridana]|uniref:putative transmembrane protein 244 n=1 Tax=Rhineura floridana TaxID=261503 RepID=UPI002AC80097
CVLSYQTVRKIYPHVYSSSKIQIVLLNLLLCVVIFYSVYYVVLCFCFTAFRLQMLDGLAPFDFKTNPSWINPYYLGKQE